LNKNKLQKAIDARDSVSALNLINGKYFTDRAYKYLYQKYLYKQYAMRRREFDGYYNTCVGDLLTDHNSVESYSPLHLAAAYGLTDVVLALIKNGVPVDSLTRSKLIGYDYPGQSSAHISPLPGYTALHFAIFFGHRDTIDALIFIGADVRQKIYGLPDRYFSGHQLVFDSNVSTLNNVENHILDIAKITCDNTTCLALKEQLDKRNTSTPVLFTRAPTSSQSTPTVAIMGNAKRLSLN
jgi:hypothetical protein